MNRSTLTKVSLAATAVILASCTPTASQGPGQGMTFFLTSAGKPGCSMEALRKTGGAAQFYCFVAN